MDPRDREHEPTPERDEPSDAERRLLRLSYDPRVPGTMGDVNAPAIAHEEAKAREREGPPEVV